MGKQWKQWQTLFCCCCYCKVASVMSDSVRPQRQQPTRLPSPWDSPHKNTEVCCHFLLQCMKMKCESEVAQSCLTLSEPMDCSLPGSSVHGIFKARVLEWDAIAFSDRGSHSSSSPHRAERATLQCPVCHSARLHGCHGVFLPYINSD